MAEDSSAFASSINWDHEQQSGSSHFSLCKDLSGICTQTNIKFNRSFADVSQIILLTRAEEQGFPRVGKNGLRTKILAAQLPLIGDPVWG